MSNSKVELEKKIKKHCDIVMDELVQEAGSAGALVSRFVCLPNEDGDCDDMLDLYIEREGIERKLKTAEFTADLAGLSVDNSGGLLYWIWLDVGDEQNPDRVGHCHVAKSKDGIEIRWENLDLDLA
jgi:hypothetical protein